MRLHPWSVLYRSGMSIGRLVWIVLIIVFTSSSSIGGPRIGILAGVGMVIVVFALAVGYQLAYYRRFEYALTDDTFDIHSGVLSRRNREIPLSRIQNVDISRNVVQRALAIAEVNLETAGGSQTEAQLRYVGEAEAVRLQDAISRLKRGERATPDETHVDDGPLFAITSRELALLGVLSLDFRVVSIITVALPVIAPSLAEQFGRFEPLAPSDPLTMIAGTGLIASIGVIAFYFAAAAVSGAFSVSNYYGFRLTRDPTNSSTNGDLSSGSVGQFRSRKSRRSR